MQRLCFLKSWIIGLTVLLAAMLSGCTAVRWVYGQGPGLSYWWLDGYADFNDTQTPAMRQALGSWFQWHRQSQLDDYAQLLVQLQNLAAGPLTAERVCSVNQEVLQRVDPMLDKALPMVVDMVRSLSPAQLQHIEQKYLKVNQKFRQDYLQPTRQQRLDASLKRTVEHAKTFYGRLDAAQLSLLRDWQSRSPFDADLWFEERQRRQQEVLGMLRRVVQERLSGEQTLAALREVATHVQHSPRARYRDYQQRLQQHNCQLVARLHQTTSAEQRAAAVRRLKTWEEDARALAAQAARATTARGQAASAP